MFSLTEATLAEMGVSRIGDRLYLVDCLQSLYEELTAWKQAKEKNFAGKVRATVPALPGAGGGSSYQQGTQTVPGGNTGRQPTALLQQLLSQGYSMQEVLALAQQRPELLSQLFR